MSKKNNEEFVRTDAGNGTPLPVPEGAIGEEAAKAAALKHAGIAESDTAYVTCHPEWDHGRMEHYDVKFVSAGMKYKYAIGTFDGAVLGRAVKNKMTKSGYVYEGNYHEHTADAAPTASAPVTPEPVTPTPVTPEPAAPAASAPYGMIGEEEAISIALQGAGLTEDVLEKCKVKLTAKHGRTIYRLKLKVRGMEYTYDVDAYTGAVTRARKEIDF